MYRVVLRQNDFHPEPGSYQNGKQLQATPKHFWNFFQKYAGV